MFSHEFTPQAKNDKGELLYTGTITVEFPSYADRMELVSSLNLTIDGDGKVNKKVQDKMALAIKMAQIGEKYIRKVNLTKYNGFKIDSVSKLGADTSSTQVFAEIASLVIHGIDLGES